MKKLILFFVTVMVCSLLCGADAQDFRDIGTVAYGRGHCSVVEGHFGSLKQKTTAKLVLDFGKTHIVQFGDGIDTIANDFGTVKEFFSSKDEKERAQWEVMKVNLKQSCTETFNKKFKMQIVEDSPKYEVRLMVDNLDFGREANDTTFHFRYHEEGGAEFNGSLVITDIATGDVVLDLLISDMKGADPSAYHRTSNRRVIFTVSDIFFGKYLPKLMARN